MTTKIITPPTAEPVSVSDVRDYLRIDFADSDNTIKMLISNARQELEKLLRRAMLTQTLQSVIDLEEPPYGDLSGYVSRQTGRLELPYSPLQSVVSVEFETQPGSYTTLNASLYSVDTASEPGRVWLTSNAFSTLALLLWSLWNEPFLPRVRITYICGYPNIASLPYQYRQMLMEMVSHLYVFRNSEPYPSGLLSKIDTERMYML